jgi:hypothetical protein
MLVREADALPIGASIGIGIGIGIDSACPLSAATKVSCACPLLAARGIRFAGIANRYSFEVNPASDKREAAAGHRTWHRHRYPPARRLCERQHARLIRINRAH